MNDKTKKDIMNLPIDMAKLSMGQLNALFDLTWADFNPDQLKAWWTADGFEQKAKIMREILDSQGVKVTK